MLVLIKKITLNSVLKNNIMKTILGLDLGSNSIGWAVINSVIEKTVRTNLDKNGRE